VTGQRPHEAAARVRADTMPSALQTADRNALAPAEEQRPQSVAEWREALLGGSSATSAPLDKTQMLPKASTRPAFDPALLKNLESELAQHLGPIANLVVRNAAKTAPTQADLVQLIALEITDVGVKRAFERKFSDGSRPSSQPMSGGSRTDPATSQGASCFSPNALERAEGRLAEHIGAVARVVVKRAAVKARDERELYLLLADEIENKEERKAFIRKAVSMSHKP
jgi:hypothetical protein